jgi:ElaA protein
MQIHWTLKKFEDLTPYQLYAILQLRNAVFVVEQNCVFQDADDNDQDSYHFMGFKGNKLIAYSRLVPSGKVYE